MINKENLHISTDTNLLNLNSNLLVAIDIRTSGPIPKKHDIYEIAILALNSYLKPHKGISPFFTLLKLKRPDNIDLEELNIHEQKKLFEANLRGLDPDKMADLFEEWFNKINFKFGKKLAILSYDWVSKRPFIEDWLGSINYNSYFDYRFRDVQVAAQFTNDKADFANTQIPLPKTTLKYICSYLDIEHFRNSTCLDHCMLIAEAYKRLILKLI